MQHFTKTWMVAVLGLASLALVGCQQHAAESHAEHPAEVEEIPGSPIKKVTLTEHAYARIDVHTGQVSMQAVAGSATPRLVVPYSAIIYDPKGATWIYTSPAPRTFVRAPIDIDYIDGDIVVLNEGPAAGTTVAVVGVPEIYGTESGVGH